MKQILAFIALALFTLSGYAQNLTSITYQNIYTIMPEQHTMLPDTAGQMEKEWMAFLRKKLPEENESLTYTFNDSIIRYERQLNKISEDEFILIEPDSGIMLLYYTDKKGRKRVNKLPMHAISEWQVQYTLDTFLSERRNILGYDCFKMLIKQEIIGTGQYREVNIFELFVTDQLKLPARLTIPLRRPVLQLCALEVKSYNPKRPEIFLTETAIEIKKEVDSGKILLPESFKNIRN